MQCFHSYFYPRQLLHGSHKPRCVHSQDRVASFDMCSNLTWLAQYMQLLLGGHARVSSDGDRMITFFAGFTA